MIKKTSFTEAFMRGQMRGSSLLRGIWTVLNIHGVPHSLSNHVDYPYHWFYNLSD